MLFLSGCGTSSQPINGNDSPEAVRQRVEQQREDLIKKLNQPAQDATKAELAKVLPDWRPVGWSFQRSHVDQQQLDVAAIIGLERDVAALQSQPVIVTVDLVKAQEHKVVSVVARQFTDDQGNNYWRTEPLTQELRELVLTPEKSSEPPR
jgi:hypothetical protein